MTRVAITEQYLEDIADAIRAKTGLSTVTYRPSEMAPAIATISGGGGITPSGTIEITENGTYNVTSYASADVDVPVGETIHNQNKTVSPTTSQQSITADSGYTGLGTVTVNAMPTMTLPTSASASATSGYTSKLTISRSTSDQYINIPTGYNSSGAYYKVNAVANGTATAPASISGSSATVSTGTNTLTLSKTISVTPSISTAGYISSGTAGNSSVSLTASVTTKAAATITPTTTNQEIASGTYLTGKQTISGDANLVSGNIKKNVSIFGVTGSYEAGGSSPVIQSLSVTPSTSEQTFNSSSVDGYKPVVVAAMSTMTLPTSASSSATSGYTSKATIGRSTSDQYINIPTGYNSAGGYYKVSAVANGSATPPSSISGTSATVSTGTNTLTLTKSISVTPTVTAGYVSSGTAGNVSVSLTGSVTTQGSQTLYPSTSDQTISSGRYLTGTQTIKAVTTSNLVASNIKQGVTITVGDSSDSDRVASVTGTYSGNTFEVYVSWWGSDSVYKLDKTFSEIKTAYNDGKEVILNPQYAPPYMNLSWGLDSVNDEFHYYVYISNENNNSVDSYHYTLDANGLTEDSGIFYYDTTSATAEPSDVLAGKYFFFADGKGEGEIPTKTSSDLTASGATVTVPSGYYASQATKSVSTMTLPTSAASSATSGYTSKATIGRSTSAQYINIPPGYNSAGGYYTISAVANGSATAPSSISGTSATVSTGTNTLTLTKTVSVTPTVSAGYISSGTAGNSSVSLTASVTVNPTPTASGATVTIPAGYYSSQTTKSVSSGSATGPSSLSGSGASISAGTNTVTLTTTGVVTTPTVSAGYVSSATTSTATVALTANVTTKAAATITPGTTNQTIASGTYLTGTQTIAGDADLVASNIVNGVQIFGVTGNVVLQNYYTGSSAPSSSTGSNGDLYLQS